MSLSLKQLIDAAAPSCRLRDRFWKDCARFGERVALDNFIAGGANSYWIPKIREVIDGHVGESKD